MTKTSGSIYFIMPFRTPFRFDQESGYWIIKIKDKKSNIEVFCKSIQTNILCEFQQDGKIQIPFLGENYIIQISDAKESRKIDSKNEKIYCETVEIGSMQAMLELYLTQIDSYLSENPDSILYARDVEIIISARNLLWQRKHYKIQLISELNEICSRLAEKLNQEEKKS